MAVELECKVRVESHEAVRARLRENNAVYLGRVLETNRLFDRDDGSLRRGGCGMRIRTVRTLDGPPVAATWTFKGPKQGGPLKRREEIETAVDHPGAASTILEKLGYFERIVFEKRRESWRLADCAVELDDLPVLGRFVEVEGPGAPAIDAVLRQLGLDQLEPISQGYAAMLAEQAAAGEGAPATFRFAES
ncbi:MAG: class IV adenylate cyclase [Phycisphaerae bacterium]